MKLAEVYSHVRNTLGISAVEVELEDEHILAGVVEAVNLINSYVPVRRWGMLPTGNTQQQGGMYVVTGIGGMGSREFLFTPRPLTPPSSPTAEYTQVAQSVILVPGIQRIIEVIGIRESALHGQLDLFDPLLYMNGSVSKGGGVAAYQLAVSYIENARRVYGSEVDWRWMDTYHPVLNAKTKRLFVSIPYSARQVYGYTYTTHITPDDDPATGLDYLNDTRHNWFYRYVVAHARVTLGDIRGKFGGLPSVDGGVLSLDSESQVQRGNEVLTQLQNELVAERPTVDTFIG